MQELKIYSVNDIYTFQTKQAGLFIAYIILFPMNNGHKVTFKMSNVSVKFEYVHVNNRVCVKEVDEKLLKDLHGYE